MISYVWQLRSIQIYTGIWLQTQVKDRYQDGGVVRGDGGVGLVPPPPSRAADILLLCLLFLGKDY